MTDETNDQAEDLHARMKELATKASALIAKLGMHEQLGLAHENLRSAVMARAEAEVAYLDLHMQRRDEWEASGFGALQINDAGGCAISAAHVRARWRHEQADLHYRQCEVAWLEWVAATMDSLP